MGNLFENLNAGIWIGFALQIIGRVIGTVFRADYTDGIGGAVLLGWIVTSLGTLIFVWGCMGYCADKGYTKWLGLLGFFSCLGFLVLLLLPARS